MINEKEIKQVIVKRLKAAGFSVPAADTDEGFLKPAVTVTIYPTSTTLFGTGLTDVTDTVALEYIPAVETREECADAAIKIRDAIMYKTLDVNDRHLTVESMEAEIEGYVLYVYFDLSYTQEVPSGEDYENMEILETRGV